MTKVIEDVRLNNGDWAKYYKVGEAWPVTHSGQQWKNMMSRCKAGSKTQANEPAYIGCTMSEMFQDYQRFVDWHREQVGYGLQDYHLDKDLLIQGNQHYSEDNCVLLPSTLNNFLVTPLKSRNKFPLGVRYIEVLGKFRALIHSEARTKCLGLYETVEGAALAYKRGKEAEARRWHERLVMGEFIVDPRVIERMRTWEHTEDRKRIS